MSRSWISLTPFHSMCLECWVTWFVCTGSHSCCDCVSAWFCHVRRHVFLRYSLNSGSYNLFKPCSMMTPNPTEWWRRWTICGWALHSQLPSVLCPVISFCINHQPAHKETSLMRSKCCTTLCSGLEGMPRLSYPQSSSNFLQGFTKERESEHDFSLF